MCQLQNWLVDKLKNKKNILIILGIILVLGSFLRIYKHHQWLYFDDDQANDAIVVNKVVENHQAWPLLGPNMGNTKFRLGPIFYYFQITSAKIFGNTPNALAYPDLLFSILTIPLFYYFLRKYFAVALALPLTGLYTVSYFAIKFSRFAWNTNSMPFFILLFLLALTEFLVKREKVKWIWALLLGLSIGVGIQLHAMLLVMMPIMVLTIFIIVMLKSPKTWLKWLVVILIVLSLNAGQIIYELNSNFQNTHSFLSNAEDRSGSRANKFPRTLALDVACHIQANTYMLATLGNKDNCDFLKTQKNNKTNRRQLRIFGHSDYLTIVLISLLFSFLGYFLLVKRFKQEKNQAKKYFLGIIIFYLVLFFGIMFSSIQEAPLRYFLPMFFLPYLFLGFVIQMLQKKYPQKYFLVSCIIFILIAILNIGYLSSITFQLENKTRNGTDDVILGELELMRNYIISESAPWKTAYLFGGHHYIFRYYRPMQYLAKKDNFSIERTKSVEKMTLGEPAFYIYQSYPEKKVTIIKGMKVLSYKNFGQVAIYKVIKIR